jgi:hypothetical protein
MDLFLSYLGYKMNIQNFVAHLISWHDIKISTNCNRLHVSRLVITAVHRLKLSVYHSGVFIKLNK